MLTTTPREVLQVSRIKTDTIYSQHMTDAEALIMINRAYKKLYNWMVMVNESLFVIVADITADPASGEAVLPDDMYKLRSVYSTGNGYDVVFEERSLQDRSVIHQNNLRGWGTFHLRNNSIFFSPKLPVGPLHIMYVPIPTNLTSLDDNITLIANEDEYLIAHLCRDIAQKEESATDRWDTELAKSESMIKCHIAPRCDGNNKLVRDVSSDRFNDLSIFRGYK